MNKGIILPAVVLSLLLPSSAWAEVETLEQALTLAYQNSHYLKSEQARVRAADEKVAQALAGWRPSIALEGGAGISSQEAPNGLGQQVSTDLHPKEMGVSITQPIFSGFRTVSGVHSSEALVKAERARLKMSEQRLLYDAAEAYCNLALAHERLVLNEENEQVLFKQYEATKDRYRVGELKKTDVSQAELRHAAAQASLEVAKGDLSNKKAAFFRLIGERAASKVSLILPFESPSVRALRQEELDNSNPSIQAANFDFESASSNEDAVDGALLPEVSLVGSINRKWDQSVSYTGQHDTATIMAKVSIPLYQGGANYSRSREAREKKSQARLSLEDIRRRVGEEASIYMQEYKTASASIAAHKLQEQAALQALEGVREEAKVGSRSTLDVLNAEQELLNAKLNNVSARHKKAIAVLKLKVVVGTLTAQALNLPVEVYDPQENYERVSGKWIGF